MQPEYINHLKVGDSVWRVASILAKHTLDGCLPQSQNRKHGQPHRASHYWEQLKVEGF